MSTIRGSKWCADSSQYALLRVVAAGIVWAVLAMLATVAFMDEGLMLKHDEAEHLHVVYALQRGERPYLDFIENHPVFPHLLLGALQHVADLETPKRVYFATKTILLVHFMGFLLLAAGWLHARRRALGLHGRPLLLFPIVVMSTGMFDDVGDWFWGHESLWQLRPDWICQFWTLASLVLLERALQNDGHRRGLYYSAASGIAAAVATAVMAKSIIFLSAMALTIIVVAMRRSERSDTAFGSRDVRHLLDVASVAIFVGGLVLAVILVYEISAANISLQAYIAGNFSLNSIKHIILNAEDFSATNVQRSLLGWGLVPALLLLIWALSIVRHAASNGLWLRYAVCVFAAMTLLINAVLPAYSNGLTWPWYFIPSMLAFCLLVSFVADEALRCSKLIGPTIERFGGTNRAVAMAKAGVFAVVGLACASIVVSRAEQIVQHLESREMVGDFREILGLARDAAFLADAWLPEDLEYLTFSPQDKPVRARAWGYFTMLTIDRNLWRDAHRLGIAPNPQTHWRERFATSPPDVVLVSGAQAMTSRQFFLKRMQQIETRWLFERVERDYRCMRHAPLQVYVRETLVNRFERSGWIACAGGEDERETDR